MNDNSLGFLAGGGEMGKLTREYPWSETALGPPEHWPQSLKTTLRTLLTTGHPMFIFWGPDLIQFYNDAYRRSLGPERHPSALGMKGKECWAEIWPIIGHQLEYVLNGKGHTWDENRLVPTTRFGKKEDVYWTYSYGPIDEPSAANGVGGVLVVCSETTEMVETERKAHEAELRWRELFNQAVGFMCIIRGPELRFEYANPRYMELIGNRDIIGKTVNEALPEISDQGFIQLLDQVYTTGVAHHGVANPVKLRSLSDTRLSQHYVDFVYQPIRDENGKVSGILVDGYEVTERVLASEQMRLADQRKDEFLAMLAHELRNPLAPIRNASELLIRTTQANSEHRTIGDVMSRQVTHLTRLVDDLLDISRITQGKIELQREAIALEDALRLAIDTVTPAAQDKQLTIVFQPMKQALYVHADLTRIIQCFTNILSNSVKYSDSGEITVKTREESGEAVVTIADQGMGIPAEKIDEIFELFVQGETSLDRSRGGLGIGLSLVKRILELHDGEVYAQSEGSGHGSCFIVELPLCSPPKAPAINAEQSQNTQRRILVVDDNRDSALTLTQLLEFEGHEAIATFGAHEALSAAEQQAPDVILLDIGLPEMDGYQLAKTLRANGCTSRLIATTGYGQASDIEKAMEAGFDHHFVKPIALAQLLKIINEAG